MKIILLAFLLSVPLPYSAFSQGTPDERKDLYDLLNTRRQKFEAYSYSLEKKSGFFGNKTKKDVQHTVEVLTEIIETDNRIIGSLNHVINFKSFEKVNSTYNQMESDERITNLRRATDTLTKQVDALSVSYAAMKSKTGRLKWLTCFFAICLAITSYYLLKRRSVSNQ